MYADTETNNPVYSVLSHPVHENLVSTSVEVILLFFGYEIEVVVETKFS